MACVQQQQPGSGAPDGDSMTEAGGVIGAGIPVSSELATATGQRLLDCLIRDASHFVPLVGVELQQVHLLESL